jgi:hypothetical protein
VDSHAELSGIRVVDVPPFVLGAQRHVRQVPLHADDHRQTILGDRLVDAEEVDAVVDLDERVPVGIEVACPDE